MRNLELSSLLEAKLSSTEVPDLLPTAVTWDGTNAVYVLLGPSQHDATVELKKILPNGKVSTVTSWDIVSPSGLAGHDAVQNLHFLAADGSVCMIFATGDLFVVNENAQEPDGKIELVGSIDAGITAACWSPDDELLVLATAEKSLLFMTRSFEVLATVSTSPNDLALSKQVSVGWGKAETQFRGKRAHALRDPTTAEVVDEGKLSPNDAGRVAISWRGDGAYVAVSLVEMGKRRVIRIYSREGIIDGVSEAVDGLEETLAWQPSGDLIAGVQHLDDRTDVVFFERNGLRHGQFSLRESAATLKETGKRLSLDWNLDSTVLSIVFQQKVQLWTSKNYHWYLKQEILTTSFNSLATDPLLSWNPERGHSLAIVASNGLKFANFAFTMTASSTRSSKDSGSVAVIDGSQLHLTPLRTANIPPPMYHHTIEADAQVLHSAFQESSSQVVLLTVKDVQLWKWSHEIARGETSTRQHSLTLPVPGAARGIAFLGAANIICIEDASFGSTLRLLHRDDSGLIEKHTLEVENKISRFIPVLESERLFIESASGVFSEVTVCSDQIVVKPWTFDGHVPKPGALATEIIPHAEDLIVFSLFPNGVLMANNTTVLKDCTSFASAPEHVVATTSQHFLKLIHLSAPSSMVVPPNDPEVDERCRAIERGARIVTVIPSKFAVVLQMPRGNLETVYPRGLVLAGVRLKIDGEEYNRAFTACRTHRIDLNVLHDHNAEAFLRNAAKFVAQIRRVDYLDQFISTLSQTDFTEVVYRNTLSNGKVYSSENTGQPTKAKAPSTTKITAICDAVLDALKDYMPERLQNVITCHVCKSPPDLRAALSLVASLREKSEEQSQEAVEHMCFLVDVKKVYECALGMYDLELALLVAQQSKMDPREYLPFLRGLQELPELRRKFKINDHLKRYPSALAQLVLLKDFLEVQKYIVLHELYKEALELYRYDNTKYSQMMDMLAQHLFSKSKWSQAGFCFEYLKNHKQALACYRSANMWREALSCAKLAPLDDKDTKQLARALLETLGQSKQHIACATIQLDYLQDAEGACMSFCKGFLFTEAMRVASLQPAAALEDVVGRGLMDALATLLELFADCKSQVNSQVPRLRELRIKKIDDEIAYYEGAGDDDIPDNVSVAASGISTSASLFTRYTNRDGTIRTGTSHRTSKNVRREERKRARGKKGSIYEEEYLVNSVERLVERINSTHQDFKSLIQALLRSRMLEQARAVRKAFAELIELLQSVKDEVFGAEDENFASEPTDSRPSGAMGVLHDTLEGRAKQRLIVIKSLDQQLSEIGI